MDEKSLIKLNVMFMPIYGFNKNINHGYLLIIGN
jgi:hypothetical protein